MALFAGQPIKVVALGGSVTKGHGPANPENSWVNRFFGWVNETFPHPQHQFTNQAIPAVSRGSIVCHIQINLDWCVGLPRCLRALQEVDYQYYFMLVFLLHWPALL